MTLWDRVDEYPPDWPRWLRTRWAAISERDGASMTLATIIRGAERIVIAVCADAARARQVFDAAKLPGDRLELAPISRPAGVRLVRSTYRAASSRLERYGESKRKRA